MTRVAELLVTRRRLVNGKQKKFTLMILQFPQAHTRLRPHLVIEISDESIVAAPLAIKVSTLVTGVTRHVFLILVVRYRVIISFAVLHVVVVVEVYVGQLTV